MSIARPSDHAPEVSLTMRALEGPSARQWAGPGRMWRRLLSLFALAVALQFWSRVQFRTSFFADLGSNLLRTAAQVIFWMAVAGKRGTVAGWGFGDIMVFMACAELFWALQRGLFLVSTRVHELINQGRLDTHLCRPLDPRLSILMLHMEPILFLRSLPGALAYFALGVATGAPLTWISVLQGMFALLLATTLFTEFVLTLSYLAFWWGHSRSLTPLFTGMWEIMRYPTDIFEWALRFLFTWVIPAIFAATWPARIMLGKPIPGGFPGVLGILSGLLVLWHGIQTLTWRKGLQRYESAGG